MAKAPARAHGAVEGSEGLPGALGMSVAAVRLRAAAATSRREAGCSPRGRRPPQHGVRWPAACPARLYCLSWAMAHRPSVTFGGVRLMSESPGKQVTATYTCWFFDRPLLNRPAA